MTMEPYESKWADDTSKRFVDQNRNSLYPLSQLDEFEVSDDDPDVRGWDVVDEFGNEIGEVEELIVDPNLMKVRYLDIEVEDELSVDDDTHHILLPIGAACVDCDEDKVVLKGVDKNQIKHIPSFTGKGVDKEYETEVRRTFLNTDPGTANPSPGTDYNDQNFYVADLYDEDYFYGPRRSDIQNPREPRRAIRRRQR